MGIWDSLKSKLGLASDDEFYDDEEYYDEDSDEAFAGPAQPSPYAGESAPSVRRIHREPDLDRARGAGAGLRSVPQVETPGGPAQVNMYICEPRSFTEAQTIADRFKVGTPVILNLTSTDPDTAKRVLDFASGLTYGRDGGLQKVSERVFMLTPANVTVSAVDRQRLRETGLFTYDGQ